MLQVNALKRASARLGLTIAWKAGVSRSFAARRGDDQDEDELKAARQWLSKLDPDTIPRDLCDVSFSRSSGPGGQNVNK